MAFIVVRVVRFYGCKSFKGLIVVGREAEAEDKDYSKGCICKDDI